MRGPQIWLTCCAATVFTACWGCAAGLKEPELGLVKGKVTLDGQPGANLMVTFEPQAAGSGPGKSQVGAPSTAVTDPTGGYELIYKGTTKGAVVGSHKVRITNAAGGGPAGGTKGEKPIKIPPTYNEQTSITKDVKKGDNAIDLDIKTK